MFSRFGMRFFFSCWLSLNKISVLFVNGTMLATAAAVWMIMMMMMLMVMMLVLMMKMTMNDDDDDDGHNQHTLPYNFDLCLCVTGFKLKAKYKKIESQNHEKKTDELAVSLQQTNKKNKHDTCRNVKVNVTKKKTQNLD